VFYSDGIILIITNKQAYRPSNSRAETYAGRRLCCPHYNIHVSCLLLLHH